MFTDTPVATIVVTPRLRSTGSRSVPAIGSRPCRRLRTRSPSTGPSSGTTSTADVPGRSCTPLLRTALNSRALLFDPRRSARVEAVQWMTEAPAARAAVHSRAALAIVPRAAAASSGRTDDSPTTPFCSSEVTTAVVAGSMSARSSRGTGADCTGRPPTLGPVPDPLPADLDHVAVAVEQWTDAWPRYLGDLAGQWLAGGRGPGFSPSQVRYPHPERSMKVEVLEPNLVELNDFLRRFLDHSGPGPHHLTFKVPDLEAALEVMQSRGYEPIGVDLSDDEWKESFIHPKQACGIVVQVAQASGDMPAEMDPPAVAPRVDRPAALVEVVHLVA